MPRGLLWTRFYFGWLTDPDIQRLSWEMKGRWAQLFLTVAQHGEGGDLYLPKGLRSLPPIWTRGVTSSYLRTILLACPGVTLIDDEPPSQGVHIVFRNWRKYQDYANRPSRTRGGPRPSPSGAYKPPTSPVQEQIVDPEHNPLPPVRSRRRATPRHVAATLAAPLPPPDPAIIPLAELHAVEDQVRDAYPTWTARQVEDEARRRLDALPHVTPNGQPDTPEATPTPRFRRA